MIAAAKVAPAVSAAGGLPVATGLMRNEFIVELGGSLYRRMVEFRVQLPST